MKIEGIVKKILEIEKKSEILKTKIDNIYFWKLLRFKLFLEVTSKKHIHSAGNVPIKKDYILFFRNLLENTMKKNKKNKNLFFISNRLQKIEDNYKEIYSYKIIDENAEIIYMPLTKNKLKNKNIDYSSIENIDYIVSELTKFFTRVDITSEELNLIKSIKKDLERDLEIDNIDILEEKNIRKFMRNFKVGYNFYKKFLQKRLPKRIYLVCSYGKEPLIAAAKDLGIEVIEIQHGVMNQYHLGYHFPNDETISYFPDKILMFGDYWHENTSIPLPKDKIEVVGYPYMELQIGKYRDTVKEKSDQVLFISQGTIGKQLTEKAVEFAKENPDLKTVVRLHPGEFSRWKTEYKVLFENKDLPNIEISDNNDKNLYEYLCESKYLIGVYSTVIYEALYLEKKVGVLNLPGIEYVEDLIANNSIKLFQIDEKIKVKSLDNLTKVSGEYYFANKRYENNE